MIIQEALTFIYQRFPNDSNWCSGNCYYFAVILKTRFPQATIYYDVIYGRFVVKLEGYFLDYMGIVDTTDRIFIEWDQFDEYDLL